MKEVVEPFLKWAGGKRNLRQHLIPLFPELRNGATYFEPFLGGGAVFFGLQPSGARLSDVNAELIDVYITVRDQVDAVIEKLEALPYSQDDYYDIRAWHPKDPASRAARFIYLNKTCFNGLFRVNLRGEFNVPFGRHGPNLEICNRQQLRAASQALSRAVISCADFAEALKEAKQGDIVYCDPPYTTAHSNNGFVEYNARVFSWDDQHRLARVTSDLVDRGVSVIVSNADHASIVDCFSKSGRLKVERIERWSTIAGTPTKRFKTSELVLVGRGPGGSR
jgi:DNA adenine methylase